MATQIPRLLHVAAKTTARAYEARKTRKRVERVNKLLQKQAEMEQSEELPTVFKALIAFGCWLTIVVVGILWFECII